MAHLGNTVINGALRVLGGENVDTINGVTVGNSPKFTDENNAVTQTATTTDAKYEILFSATADNTTRTEGARKAATLRFNPSTGSLMEGQSTVASGTNSHAEGSLTTANGTSCHAEGGNTKSVGDYSHSEGYMTTAINGSHAEGNRTIASKQDSHSEGYKTEAKGDISHAEGSSTTASGENSHSEGSGTKASGSTSHAEGYQTTALGKYSHAEGQYTCASGSDSHAEGNATRAIDSDSHAEGNFTRASAMASHAEGYNTTASGNKAHAEGEATSAANSCAHAEGYGSIASGQSSHAEGNSTIASGNYSHAEGSETTAQGTGSHAEGNRTSASGDYSHSEGQQTTASSEYSHAEGCITSASGKASHAEGYQTKATANYAHAEGRQTTASSEYSHAEGYQTSASGNFTSHAEGYVTSAFGNYGSHSEGYKTRASGTASHAEGDSTTASGNYSHASGQGTSAGGVCQTVIGKYNVADTDSLFIIGNGSGNTLRSNALRIDSSGRFYPSNTFPESYLGWNEVSAGDGRDLVADASPIDACLNDALKGNRFYGIPDSNISITYSRNAGSTWTDYGGEAYQKTALFSEGSNFVIGKADGTNKATANGNKYQLRVWIDTLNVCYTVLRKIMVNVSTQGSNECTMDFEVSTDNSSWTKIRTMGVAGWSGWNVLNVGWIQTHNAYRYLRFTFKANGGDTNYNGLCVYQIYGYGGFGWLTSSQMASGGAPYIAYGSKAAQFLGTLAVSSNNYNNYNEGFRVNRTLGNGAAVITMGGSWGSLSGMSDYAWCFVTWSTVRKLHIGHGTGASASNTYFYKNDAGATPSLHIGENLQVDGTITGRMADYAEYFEWADGNPQAEERIAKFVTFDDGNKIRFATSNDDYILGVVSAHPFIIGNADGDDRDNEYLKDEYGRVIIEPAPKMKSSTDGKYIPVYDENGEPVYEGTRPKPNPNYDSSKNIPRDKKPEWAPIGMLGILTVIDDGTCTVNSYATVAEGGIATKAETNSLFKYRVIKRRSNNIIDIIFR